MKKYRKLMILLVGLLFITINTSTSAMALTDEADLGAAKEFNIFVIEDMIKNGADSEGRIAIGGDAKLSDYQIGSRLDESTTRSDLIINGKVNLNQVRMKTGMIATTSNAQVELFNVEYQHGNNLNNKQPLLDNSIDFDKEASYLKNLSSYWGSLSSNKGTVGIKYSALELEGKNADYNVFTIDPEKIDEYDWQGLTGNYKKLSDASGVNIKVPENSTILINIIGKNIVIPVLEPKVNGTSNSKNILWNFMDAKYIECTKTIKGSILAPLANFKVLESAGQCRQLKQFKNIDYNYFYMVYLNLF